MKNIQDMTDEELMAIANGNSATDHVQNASDEELMQAAGIEKPKTGMETAVDTWESVKPVVAGGIMGRTRGFMPQIRGAQENTTGALKSAADYYGIDNLIGKDWSEKGPVSNGSGSTGTWEEDPDVAEYSKTRDQAQKEYSQQFDDHPVKYMAGAIGQEFIPGGGLGLPQTGPIGAIKNVAEGMAVAASGSNGDNVIDDAKNIGIGGGLALATHGATKLVGSIGRKIFNKDTLGDAYELGKVGRSLDPKKASDDFIGMLDNLESSVQGVRDQSSKRIGQTIEKYGNELVDRDSYIESLKDLFLKIKNSPNTSIDSENLKKVYMENIANEVGRYNAGKNPTLKDAHNFKRLMDSMTTSNSSKFAEQSYKFGKDAAKTARSSVMNTIKNKANEVEANLYKTNNKQLGASQDFLDKYIVETPTNQQTKDKLTGMLINKENAGSGTAINANRNYRQFADDLIAIDPKLGNKLATEANMAGKQANLSGITSSDITNFSKTGILNASVKEGKESIAKLANSLGSNRLASKVIDTFQSTVQGMESKGIKLKDTDRNRIFEQVIKTLTNRGASGEW